MGEVTATNRPQNSLLDKLLEFDVQVAPAPKITADYNKEIESSIKKHILDDDFDDKLSYLARRSAKVPQARENETNVPQTRSERGLADIYEEKFLDAKNSHLKNRTPFGAKSHILSADSEELSPVQMEALKLFASLSRSLEALSNFHYTPKAPKQWNIRKKEVPAIQLEEKLPITEAKQIEPRLNDDTENAVYKEKKERLFLNDEKSREDRKRQKRKRKSAFKNKLQI
ncbi:U3 snoRNP protein [Bonamia ostreae]|uniref:U3 snoRNP protein n=1 Tax=Bonamia ostreae TaxID=126728 RepID=A0ABV2AJ84_9EUKA